MKFGMSRPSRCKVSGSSPGFFRVLLILVVLCGMGGSAQPDVLSDRQPKFMIVGYVFGPIEIQNISAEKLTHINYAFARVTKEGEIVLTNPEAPGRLKQLQSLKAKNPSLKIILSVGGWGADNFSDAALSAASRESFAKSAVTLIKRYSLDGIDLDWEYPGQPGPGIKYRPEDKENFTHLLKAVREHLDALSNERKLHGMDRYTLSIASADGRSISNTPRWISSTSTSTG